MWTCFFALFYSYNAIRKEYIFGMNIFAFIQKSNKFIYLIRETIAKLHTLLRTAKEVISWTLQNKYVLLVHTVTATANAKCSTKINPNAHL